MTEFRNGQWLAQFRRTVTSQNGEDGVIEKVFSIIGTANRWCVEFGAGSGRKGNNTWNLIRAQGWAAVLIEGDRALFKKLVQNYTDLPRVHCLRAYVSARGQTSLDALLAPTPIPIDFDFLSIDIDGEDYHVWQAVEKYQPRAVMIEFNHGIPLGLDFIQPQDLPFGIGSSLTALNKLAQAKGYELIYAYAFNALFVRRELYELITMGDNSPEKVLVNPSPSKRFFELPDGSIVLLDVEPAQLLSRRKKIQTTPVWVLSGGRLEPLKFQRDWRLFRIIKNIIKGSFIYPLIYPLVMGVYGYVEKKRRQESNII